MEYPGGNSALFGKQKARASPAIVAPSSARAANHRARVRHSGCEDQNNQRGAGLDQMAGGELWLAPGKKRKGERGGRPLGIGRSAHVIPPGIYRGKNRRLIGVVCKVRRQLPGQILSHMRKRGGKSIVPSFSMRVIRQLRPRRMGFRGGLPHKAPGKKKNWAGKKLTCWSG